MPIRKILCLLFFAVLLSSGVEAKKKDKLTLEPYSMMMLTYEL